MNLRLTCSCAACGFRKMNTSLGAPHFDFSMISFRCRSFSDEHATMDNNDYSLV